MKWISKLFKKKPTLKDKLIEMYGEEAGNFYEMVNRGIPIGGFEETIEFLTKVEKAKKAL